MINDLLRVIYLLSVGVPPLVGVQVGAFAAPVELEDDLLLSGLNWVALHLEEQVFLGLVGLAF